VFDLLEQLVARGKGVLLISSDFAELAAVCHRVLVLRNGRLGTELDGQSLTEARIVAACYGRDDPRPGASTTSTA
jgi:ribose transport system ATP-binding protein